MEVEEELTIKELVQLQVINEDFKIPKKAYTSKIKLAKAAGISSQLAGRLLLAMANEEHWHIVQDECFKPMQQDRANKGKAAKHSVKYKTVRQALSKGEANSTQHYSS